MSDHPEIDMYKFQIIYLSNQFPSFSKDVMQGGKTESQDYYGLILPHSYDLSQK